MTHAPLTPNAGALRLVRPGETPAEPISRAPLSKSREQVRRETQRAALLTDDDARRIFAMRAAEALQGGRAALLTTDRRERLMTISRAMGLRPFDAALVIAITQDAARRGVATPADHPEVQSRLSLVAPPSNPAREAQPPRSPWSYLPSVTEATKEPVSGARSAWRRFFDALICSAAITALAGAIVIALVRWITR